MKIDYLEDGADDCPLIRLYAFQPFEAECLRRIFERLAEGSQTQVRLEDVLAVEAMDSTRLTMIVGNEDKGIDKVGDHSFVLTLTLPAWQQVAELTAPFGVEKAGFQWLSTESEISLLLSSDGHW